MKTLCKNDIIPLTITELVSDGNGVGFYDGFPVFVPASVPGDVLNVRIVKICKSHAYGIIHEITVPSDDRIEPDCPVWKTCGGCDFRQVSYDAELREKEKFVKHNMKCFAPSADPEYLPILTGPSADRYRNKAQYPIRLGADGTVQIGFYAKRSHRVVPCDGCLLQPAVFSQICDTVLEWIARSGAKPYDEISGKGLLRHLYLRESYDHKIMVCLIVTGKKVPFSKTLVEMLTSRFSAVTSVLLNINRSRNNVILGDEMVCLFGDAVLFDKLCNVSLSISPLSFLQINRGCTERLYQQAAEFAGLTDKETVIDLYCGAGTIGLSMAHKAKEIIGVEIVPAAVENARENARKSGITNASFICADAAKGAKILQDRGVSPDVVIVDPPRKGCERSLLQTIAEMHPQRIVMVSCNSATMARDVQYLASLGYVCKKIRPADMFPRTRHVESVVLLTKVHKKKCENA